MTQEINKDEEPGPDEEATKTNQSKHRTRKTRP